MAHARLSASSAHRWMVCPGSVKLASKFHNTTSQHAAAGKVAHDLAASCLSGALAKPEFRLGDKLLVEGFEIVIDREMVEGVQFYLNTIDQDLRSGDKTFVEVDLTPALKKVHPDLGGTADFVRWRPKTKQLRVVDLKYGAGKVVSVTENKQLMMYALGALLNLREPVTEVIVTIVQPRIEHEDGRVRDWKFQAAELLNFAADVDTMSTLTRQENAPLVPGETQCHWCPARHVCPELEKKQHALVAQEFSAELVPYDPQALSTALDAIPLVEARIKALREFAYAEAERGNPPPGYKLVAKRATRKFIDEAAVVKWCKPRAIDPYEEPTLKSPAQVEKAVKLTKSQKEDLAQLIVSVSSGHTLVPDSDKRPAVHQALAHEFAVITGTAEEK